MVKPTRPKQSAPATKVSPQRKSPPKSSPSTIPAVWKGPEEDGVTFSLLSRFLVCRERFRLLVVEGLKAQDEFNHRIEYGNMWHVCEEAYSSDPSTWHDRLRLFCVSLARQHPLQGEQVQHWYDVCRIQFPVYVQYWQGYVENKSVYQEEVFKVPYKLPSGRIIFLRGKWDRTFVKDTGYWLQENKTKGDVKEGQIQRQLTFDLQTMLYTIALRQHVRSLKKGHPLKGLPFRGVRYNVVRRPLSGGEGDIRQGAKESREEFHERLKGVLDGTGKKRTGENYTGPPHWFMRWDVIVTEDDCQKFVRTCLDPILEQLCLWWDEVSGPISRSPFEYRAKALGIHWRHPFGVFNPLDEGGCSDVDEYLNTGNTVGLTRTTNLFPELS